MYPMEQLDRLRAKQDYIIKVAEGQGLDFSLQIMAAQPGSPTLQDLRHMVWPEWEFALDHAIQYLEAQKHD